MTPQVLVQGLACGLLDDFPEFPVAYDSPVPIDMDQSGWTVRDQMLIYSQVICSELLRRGIARLFFASC